MNTDQMLSTLRQLIMAAAAAYATKKGMDGEAASAAAGGIIAALNFAWSVYAHWNMRKVPDAQAKI